MVKIKVLESHPFKQSVTVNPGDELRVIVHPKKGGENVVCSFPCTIEATWTHTALVEINGSVSWIILDEKTLRELENE